MIQLVSSLFYFIVAILTFFALQEYNGSSFIYLLFTIIANILLYFGFRKNAIFFDTFIGVFLWLGFWLKTTVRVIFMDSQFKESVGAFDGSGQAFDNALIITSIAFLALIIASFIRERFIFTYPDKGSEEKSALFLFYTLHRKKVLVAYAVLFITVAVSNFYLGIYQRGELTHTVLPFGLNGIYKWLLLFGLSSFAAIILKYEFNLEKKTTFFVPILTLLELFMTNISLLSRGMVLNAGALGFGILKSFKSDVIRTNKKFLIFIPIIFIFLFLFSVISVNVLRGITTLQSTNGQVNLASSAQGIKIVFLDRWVGIEGVLAVSNSEKKSWKLFNDALNEKYNENETSFYDLNLIKSPYLNINKSLHHRISLPGFIAFFYYAGSALFLFSVLFVLSLLASSIEYLAYRLSGRNLILAALIAQVIAYRYAHFGYVPAQSYLLFGSIFLNILIIYGFNKALTFWYQKKNSMLLEDL